MENPYTRKLAEYIAASRFEQIPQPIVEHVKLLVLDTIGVGVFGSALPWSERLRGWNCPPTGRGQTSRITQAI